MSDKTGELSKEQWKALPEWAEATFDMIADWLAHPRKYAVDHIAGHVSADFQRLATVLVDALLERDDYRIEVERVEGLLADALRDRNAYKAESERLREGMKELIALGHCDVDDLYMESYPQAEGGSDDEKAS